MQLTAEEEEFEDVDETAGTAETVEVYSILDRLSVNYSNIGCLSVPGRGSFLRRMSGSSFFTRSNSMRVRSRNQVADILGVALQVELENEEDGTASEGQRTSLAGMKGTLVSRSTLKFAGSDLELIEANAKGNLKVKLVNPEPAGLMSRHHWSPPAPAREAPRPQQTITEGPVNSLDLEPTSSSLLQRRMMTRTQNPDDLVIRF
jgi:hypothetical protein